MAKNFEVIYPAAGFVETTLAMVRMIALKIRSLTERPLTDGPGITTELQ